MTLKKNPSVIHLCALLSFFILLQCGGGNPTTPTIRDPKELVDEGWAAFESGNFQRAAVKFDSAKTLDSIFAEAYNGAGWAHGRLTEFEQASEDFKVAVGLKESLIEAHAGASFAYHAANRFEQSISEALFTLEAEPHFIFSHDTTVDSMDIRVTLALSYFSIADFANAAEQMDIVDPFNRPHSTNPDELIREIMRFFQQINL
ncbi:MAG: tetratricopeptide repeat protein [bacterium]